MTAITHDRSRRSFSPVTDQDLRHLGELAAAHHSRFRAAHPDWAKTLLAMCLAQGAARHRLYEDCGVKDFDVWLFYALPPERQASHFPWNRNVVHVDFGPSAHGRQEYTSDEWANPGYNVAQWDTFTGRRVDLLARAIPPHVEGPRAAVRDWLRRGLRHRPQRGKGRPSAWWLAQKPVIDLAATKLGETWWDPRSTDLPAAD